MKPRRRKKDPKSGIPLVAPNVAQSLERTQIGKYYTKGGHGFVAEDANTFADKLVGKQAEVVGITNECNGADRISNGVCIQCKYYQTAAETISSAFDTATGKYRYNGQVLEVPKDQYEACLKIMRDRITKGQVSGITDPSEAPQIVKEGNVTYTQAKNIARAGNVDSLTYDAKTQSVTSAYVASISFLVRFAQNCRNGDSPANSAKGAFSEAFATGTTSLVTGLVGAQVLRTKAAAIGAVAVRKGVKAISTSGIGRGFVNRIAAGSLGKAVYGGAAINHVSKLVRSNVVTGTVATIVTSTPDFYRALISHSISWQQLAKNVFANVGGVAGGVVGWMGGAAAGAAIGSIVPVVGTAAGGVIGGIIGSLGGGCGGSAVAKFAADKVVDDDAKRLNSLLEEVVATLASEYLLTEKEVEALGLRLGKVITPKWLRSVYKAGRTSAGGAANFMREELEPHFEKIAAHRAPVTLPPPDDLQAAFAECVSNGAIQ